jgi:hypothetical protein
MCISSEQEDTTEVEPTFKKERQCGVGHALGYYHTEQAGEMTKTCLVEMFVTLREKKLDGD